MKLLKVPNLIKKNYFLADHVEFGRVFKGRVLASGESGDHLPVALTSFLKSAAR